MTAIAFIDAFSPRSYDHRSMAEGPLGGTEASIVRIAERLAPSAKVSVLQKACLTTTESPSGVIYRGIGDLDDLARRDHHDVVVIINSPKILSYWRRRNPESELILWLHNFPGKHVKTLGHAVENAGARLVTVSRSHRRAIKTFIGKSGGPELGDRLTSIYNPIEPIEPDDTPIDPDKLIFASSPHKGIEQVLAAFEVLRKRRPSAKLVLANPGYWPDELAAHRAGVRFLGRLSHPELMQEIRSSFCLFYPQTRFAETFGLVMAEANAVGIPVLAHHGLGANDEVLRSPGQTVDAGDHNAVTDRMLDWWSYGAPIVSGQPAFDADHVAEHWRALLGLEPQLYQQSRLRLVR